MNRWRGVKPALQSRSLTVSFCLHVGLAGVLYGFGFGAMHWQESRQLAITFEQPEPTPYIEEVPEPLEEEEQEIEDEYVVEVDRPVIQDSPDEPLPEPEFLLEEDPPEKPIQDELWLTRVRITKAAPPAEKQQVQPEQKPLLPTIEPKPLIGKNPAPIYPKFAVRNGLEGTTLLEVKVDDEGIVGDVHVVESSGYKILDEAALRAVKNWLFDSGPGTARVPIIFTLHSRK